jgi:hypothetical protein
VVVLNRFRPPRSPPHRSIRIARYKTVCGAAFGAGHLGRPRDDDLAVFLARIDTRAGDRQHAAPHLIRGLRLTPPQASRVMTALLSLSLSIAPWRRRLRRPVRFVRYGRPPRRQAVVLHDPGATSQTAAPAGCTLVLRSPIDDVTEQMSAAVNQGSGCFAHFPHPPGFPRFCHPPVGSIGRYRGMQESLPWLGDTCGVGAGGLSPNRCRESTCYDRAFGRLGASRGWPATAARQGGRGGHRVRPNDPGRGDRMAEQPETRFSTCSRG